MTLCPQCVMMTMVGVVLTFPTHKVHLVHERAQFNRPMIIFITTIFIVMVVVIIVAVVVVVVVVVAAVVRVEGLMVL